jgi:hypothetical protein
MQAMTRPASCGACGQPITWRQSSRGDWSAWSADGQPHLATCHDGFWHSSQQHPDNGPGEQAQRGAEGEGREQVGPRR